MAEILEPLYANHVTFSHCEHGTVYIQLHLPDGRIFAIAAFPLEGAVETSIALAECVEAAAGELGVRLEIVTDDESGEAVH